MADRVRALLLTMLATVTIPASPAPGEQRRPPAPPPIPDTLQLEFAPDPIWLSVKAATAADGTLDATAFGESAGIILSEILKSPVVGGCRHVDTVFIDYYNPSPRDSLESAIASAQVSILGRVINKEFGFYGGVPGQLFQVRPERRFTGTTPADYYYFFTPVGDFRAGGMAICKSDPEFAAPPEVGEEVVLLTDAPAGMELNLLPVQNPGDVLPVSRDGLVRLPSNYREDSPPSAAGRNWKAAMPLSKGALLARLEAAARPR